MYSHVYPRDLGWFPHVCLRLGPHVPSPRTRVPDSGTPSPFPNRLELEESKHSHRKVTTLPTRCARCEIEPMFPSSVRDRESGEDGKSRVGSCLKWQSQERSSERHRTHVIDRTDSPPALQHPPGDGWQCRNAASIAASRWTGPRRPCSLRRPSQLHRR